MRCGKICITVQAKVAPALIIRQNDDDIGVLC